MFISIWTSPIPSVYSNEMSFHGYKFYSELDSWGREFTNDKSKKRCWWWGVIIKCLQNRPGKNLKGYMNSVIIIKIIILHLHSTLLQNEFQSNLPNIFSKHHLAESPRVSSGVGPCSCSHCISRHQRAGLRSWGGEIGLWDAARGPTRPFSLGCQVLLHTEGLSPSDKCYHFSEGTGGKDLRPL